jgi:hypothetical protein
MPTLVKTENSFIPELVPQGFHSWNAFYRHKERVEKIKYWAQGFLGAFVLLAAYALNGYIDMMM